MARVGLDPTLNAISALFIVSIAVMVGCTQYLRRLGGRHVA
jgi:ABC-type spermidine/putrescine transport system permease subunit II